MHIARLARCCGCYYLTTTTRLARATSSSSLATTTRRFSTTQTTKMTSTSENQDKASSSSSYVPPKVWKWETKNDDNKFAAINQPTAGARFERTLPKGKHALQLYSLATPNGQKVTILLEELLLLQQQQSSTIASAEYDAWLIDIMNQDQFGSDFVAINPNSKIPALVDYHSHNDDATPPTRVFESGSILLYLAEKFAHPFLPPAQRTEILNWLFWQMGAAPYLGGGFGHFYAYANEKQEYPINRFTMETKRQLSVLENQLKAQKEALENKNDEYYICGGTYTLADIAIFPWYGSLVLGELYGDAATFLNVDEDYPHVVAWARRVAARPGVQRGRIVNRTWGEGVPHLKERHEAADIDAALAAAEKETDK